jgi:hypothetical protein
MQNDECKMPNAKCRMQNAECKMPNAKCRMQNAECKIPNTKFRMQNAECTLTPNVKRRMQWRIDVLDSRFVFENTLLILTSVRKTLRWPSHLCNSRCYKVHTYTGFVFFSFIPDNATAPADTDNAGHPLEVLVESDVRAPGRACSRPLPPRPPRRAKRNANSQTDTKVNGFPPPPETTRSPEVAANHVAANHVDPSLPLSVALAPVSRPAAASTSASGSGRHCRHCTMSQQNFPERLDKASNTDKSCGKSKSMMEEKI